MTTRTPSLHAGSAEKDRKPSIAAASSEPRSGAPAAAVKSPFMAKTAEPRTQTPWLQATTRIPLGTRSKCGFRISEEPRDIQHPAQAIDHGSLTGEESLSWLGGPAPSPIARMTYKSAPTCSFRDRATELGASCLSAAGATIALTSSSSKLI